MEQKHHTEVEDGFVRVQVSDGSESVACVPPYLMRFHVNVKMRWREQNALEVMCREFRMRDAAYYKRAMRNGQLRVNGRRCSPDTVLKNGDVIDHHMYFIEGVGSGERIGVVHEDADRLVVYKPPGMPCHPQGRYSRMSLIKILQRWMARRDGVSEAYLHVINRLDRVTSGIVILAKNVACARHLSAQLQQEGDSPGIQKIYIAKVVGEFPLADRFQHEADDTATNARDEPSVGMKRPCPDTSDNNPQPEISRVAGKDEIRVRARIRLLQLLPGMPLEAEIHPEGKAAVTCFRRLAYVPSESPGGNGYSIVRCRPVTGRTHQIRVHLQLLGHPIADDPIYGTDVSLPRHPSALPTFRPHCGYSVDGWDGSSVRVEFPLVSPAESIREWEGSQDTANDAAATVTAGVEAVDGQPRVVAPYELIDGGSVCGDGPSYLHASVHCGTGVVSIVPRQHDADESGREHTLVVDYHLRESMSIALHALAYSHSSEAL
ncbi:unnamed protein product [Vitrella brassicaformis CCMP3155]|uniref:Pseudouridine synthase RsuA/RluA-like domain-containing protein n=1 Tax=Vitrella brassicaformis (strain CCMP3155) TaxID=1169540 RepID=A0A0G4F6X1_VITBC|nr:unnamed protein product [Vitrella brassicaformis CCMP3155]|eukprot:CEM07763.1 unnamed protein product [Vitrella brassicaformis CCMP3155]